MVLCMGLAVKSGPLGAASEMGGTAKSPRGVVNPKDSGSRFGCGGYENATGFTPGRGVEPKFPCLICRCLRNRAKYDWENSLGCARFPAELFSTSPVSVFQLVIPYNPALRFRSSLTSFTMYHCFDFKDAIILLTGVRHNTQAASELFTQSKSSLRGLPYRGPVMQG
jgi:hypothetical protein